ncbi:MAG: hypothetical protein JXB62_13595 [Pirellulales bacterium]|nr:hypothetical protein [Pirellulales bacterium]
MPKTATIHAQQRWEYALVERRTETTLVSDINKEGDLGWELVQVLRHDKPKGTFWTAFLKRPHIGPSHTTTTDEKTVSTNLEGAKKVQPTAQPKNSEGDDSPDIFDFQ